MKKKTYHKIKSIADIKKLRKYYDDDDQLTVKHNGEKVTIVDLLFFYDGQELTVTSNC